MRLVYKGAHSALRLEVNGVSIRLVPFEPLSVTEAQLKTLKGRKHFNSLIEHNLLTLDTGTDKENTGNDGAADSADHDSNAEDGLIDANDYTKSDLVALAEKAGIEVNSRDSKTAIAKLLNERKAVK